MIRRRLLTGGISNFLGRFTTAGVWFLLTPLMLAHLKPGGYALWVLMGAVVSYGYLLDFGIGDAVVKYVAEHLARGERAAAQRLVATAKWLTLGFALLGLSLAVIVANVLPHLLSAPAAQRQTAVYLVLLTGIDIAIGIAIIPYLSVLRGLQRYDLFNSIAIAACLVQAAGTIAVLMAGWDVVGMIGVNIPITLCEGLAAGIMITRIAPDLVPRWRSASREDVRRITSFSSSGFAIDMAARLQTRTDEWVIAMFLPVTAVTPYALARRLGEVTALAAVQCLKVVMPIASELEASDDRQKLRHLYITGSRLALAVAAPVAAVLMVVGGPVLGLWVGPKYAGEGALVAILAAASLLASSQALATQILLGIARHRLVAISAVASGLANVVLSIVLLQWFGLPGVAIGTLIPNAVTSLCVVIPFANRTLGVSPGKALRKIWVPGLLPAIGASVVLWLLQRHSGTHTPAEVIAWVATAGLVYVIGYLAMPACAAERGLLLDAMAAVSPRLRLERAGVAARKLGDA
jgi:O-antigen/teichoic acid export membrane protein